MKQWNRKWIAGLRLRAGLILVTIGLTGCETLMTRGDLRETDQKRQFQDQVSTLQKSNADVGSRFADIEQELRSMNGRVEVAESKLSQNNQETIKSKALLEQSSQEHSKKIQILQEEISKLHEQVATLNSEMSALKAASAESSERGDRGTRKDHFEIADDYFSKKEWKKAIVSYQKFREANGKSKKFAEATYKIGICFQELGLKEEAKTFFDEVVAKYPNSAEAKKAKIHLKSLKK